jgi:hypothetical protein
LPSVIGGPDSDFIMDWRRVRPGGQSQPLCVYSVPLPRG